MVNRLRTSWPHHQKHVRLGVFSSLTLGLAPFYPHAHIYKQIMNIVNGTLTEWIDVLDLLMHGAPWVFLMFVLIRWALDNRAAEAT